MPNLSEYIRLQARKIDKFGPKLSFFALKIRFFEKFRGDHPTPKYNVEKLLIFVQIFKVKLQFAHLFRCTSFW